jgi:hypothetical protein
VFFFHLSAEGAEPFLHLLAEAPDFGPDLLAEAVELLLHLLAKAPDFGPDLLAEAVELLLHLLAKDLGLHLLAETSHFLAESGDLLLHPLAEPGDFRLHLLAESRDLRFNFLAEPRNLGLHLLAQEVHAVLQGGDPLGQDRHDPFHDAFQLVKAFLRGHLPPG